jgi:4-amino-4-deoxy-L-arabinose transferase-like glycosyltransferase
MAICAGVAVLATLDGPGLTIDEPLDVRPGRTYLHTLFDRGWHFFDPVVVDSVFRDNAEHPPLGRWLLGIASVFGEPFEVLWKGPDPSGLYVLSGRQAPALAFAAIAGLVALVAGRRWGPASGVAAAFALIAMPRVFAHAHLAALDTFLSLFWTLAVITTDRSFSAKRPMLAVVGAGAVWSLALLTKIHAWLLLPILGTWAFLRLSPRRALAAIAIWVFVGFTLFFVGWPWLWYAPGARLQAYWGTGVARQPIMVEYFGRVYADRDVPWHYPWFYFVATVPAGLQALGVIGVVQGLKNRRADPFPLLLLVTILSFLVLFSTRVPVYDGERLFLHVFPAWSLLIGLGFGSLWNYVRAAGRTRVALALCLIAQGYGVVALHPFGLSYYNGLVGGLPAAKRLGLELTYWNDAVDGVLLDGLARLARPGDSAALVPTLYPGQGILTTNRTLARRGIILADEQEATHSEWIVLSRRTAYWRPQIKDRLLRGGARMVASRFRQGVWLAALWHFPAAPKGVRSRPEPPKTIAPQPRPVTEP